MAGMILDGRQIDPERLIQTGFVFKYPELRGALQALQGSDPSN
jgi:NAD dependent epimerase/dehydratase family enzyme